MITVQPDKSYRVTAADELYDYDRYTSRTNFQWRGGPDGPFHAGIYAAGEVAPTPPKTQDAVEIVEVLDPNTLLEPVSKPGAPYRIVGVLYQALVPLNDDGTVDWSRGGVGNGTNMAKPEDGKSYFWFQALGVERASDPKKCFIWTVHGDRDFIKLEEPDIALPPPEHIDTRVTVVAGKTTFFEAVMMKDGAFKSFERIGEGAMGGTGGGVVPAGSGGSAGSAGSGGSGGSGGASESEVVEDERWPDAIIDYHMGKYTNIASKADPRFLLGPNMRDGDNWPLGVGGWIVLRFDRGFPVGPEVSLRYYENEKPQHIHVLVAKINVDPASPVRYLGGKKSAPTSSNVYSANIEYGPPGKWPGDVWRLVGTTEKFAKMPPIEMPLDASVNRGIHHYMLIVDSRNPDYSGLEKEPSPALVPKGGPDIKSISVFWSRKPTHFLLLLDGSKSQLSRTDGREKYRKLIKKCVIQALSSSRPEAKKLTILMIRGDYDKETAKITHEYGKTTPIVPIEPIMEGIMNNLDSGWKRPDSDTTPLAKTVDLAVNLAEAEKSKWIPSVIILSDGIADPNNDFKTKGAAEADILKKAGSEILGRITTSNGDVNMAFTRLGNLDVAHATRLAGPWIMDNNVRKKLADAYARFNDSKNPLETFFGLDDNISHESVYHTDCRLGSESNDNRHRINKSAAKRLIRDYTKLMDQDGNIDSTKNEGFQRCPGWNGEPEAIGSYSLVLDRDVHETGNARINQAAVFKPFQKDANGMAIVWEKVRYAEAEVGWQDLEPTKKYKLDPNHDVWTPVV